MWDQTMIIMIIKGMFETLYMTLASTLFAYVIGLPIGIILVITDKEGIHPIYWLNNLLNIVVNFFRSIPFLILLLAIRPFTRLITGTTIGTSATVVPLVVAAAPFIARLIESSIKEVDKGVVEAAKSMGASAFEIIYKVLLPEAKPSIIIGAAIATTTILGYSAMAGAVGGGGLGDIAIRYGLHRYETSIMLVTVALLVVVVQILQEIGMKIAKSGDKRITG